MFELPKHTRFVMRRDPEIRRDVEWIAQNVKNNKISFPYTNSLNEKIATVNTNHHCYTIFDTGTTYEIRYDFRFSL